MSQDSAEQAMNDEKVLFGFWLYIMTDCVLFATLFATFVVMRGSTFGGEGGSSLFHLPYVLAETLVLLTSSFTCGLALLAARWQKVRQTLSWFMATALLGATFLALELHEFKDLVASGNAWHRSGFLSSYFTLVGTHGLHITVGLIWMLTMMVRIASSSKITPTKLRQITMLSLFWHFLDVIWIFIFSIVYLVGAL